VPLPEPLRQLEPYEAETRKMHALEEYGVMHVKLYEDIARHGRIAKAYDYPVKVEGRYVMAPSPIPRFDNPKMANCPAIQLFGAGASSASTRSRPTRTSSASISRITLSRPPGPRAPARSAAPKTAISTR
jgi:alpha-D-ribose 1-methylphosphonate 5-phosphate C-P lyase